MITNLQYLGIYEDSINDAIESAEHAMEQEGFSESEINDMHEMVMDELEESGDWKQITNSIIYAYFIVTADLIRHKRKDADVDYYVNGHDSHFYIDGEEIN